MGREIRRVPLDFNWPLGVPWEGFVNPHYRECPDPDCQAGGTSASRWLMAICRLLALAGEKGASRRPHPWLMELPLAPYAHGKTVMEIIHPNEQLREVVLRLTKAWQKINPDKYARDIEDDYNREYDIYRMILHTAGMPKGWGVCPTCKGDNIDPAVKDAYNAWKEKELPEGPGWQMWETVSEGSPVTPVFATPEELIKYLTTPHPENKWHEKASVEAATAFVMREGSVCSMVIQNGKMYRGVESAVLGGK